MATRSSTPKTNTRTVVVPPGGVPPSIEGVTHPPSVRPRAPLQKSLSTEELSNLVSKLSAKEKQELFGRLSLDLSQKKAGSAKSSDRDLELWVSAVQEELSKALGDVAGAGVGTEVIKRVLRDADAVEPVMKLMTRAGLDSKTPAERLVMFRYLAELLLAGARKLANYTGAPLTPKFVAQRATNIASYFDAAFPGYLAAGLASVVAGQLIRRAGR